MISDAPWLVVVCGTRPEALKLSPIVNELRRRNGIGARVLFSGQHGALLSEIARELGLTADIDLPTTPPNDNTVSASVAKLIEHIDQALSRTSASGVIVQGDTNTAFAGALVAFHRKLPVFHVEAGLRTVDPHVPFPEEMNRRLITRLAARHYAPTEAARRNLLAEGIASASIRVTGNPIIDTLEAHRHEGARKAANLLAKMPGKHHVVVTLHRRENADVVDHVTEAVLRLLDTPDTDVLWVAHPNPTGSRAAALLEKHDRIALLGPQPYTTFLGLMQAAALVLSDSGGVQEEGPALGVPVLVLRTTTERPEGVASGNCRVIDPDTNAIVEAARELLTNDQVRAAMSQPSSPYGDGRASRRIVDDLEDFFRPRR